MQLLASHARLLELLHLCLLRARGGHVGLRCTKQAMRNVKTMDAPQAYEYLMAKNQALQFADPEKTRNKGIEEFIDKKTYRPGLEAVKRPE